MLIDMGRMVEDVFRQSKTGGRKCNVTWLAARLNCDRRNVYDIFRRPTIDSQLLAQLSIVLEHNFFRDIAEMIEIHINKKSPTTSRACHFIYFYNSIFRECDKGYDLSSFFWPVSPPKTTSKLDLAVSFYPYLSIERKRNSESELSACR